MNPQSKDESILFDATGWSPELVRVHVVELIEAKEQRYLDRFDTLEKSAITATSAAEKAVNAALAAQEKAVNAALAASEKAVSVAETNAEKWRDNANEWRGAMSDREARFVTTTEFNLLKERLDRSEGSGHGMRDMWGWILAAILAGVTVLNQFSPRASPPPVVIQQAAPTPAPTQ